MYQAVRLNGHVAFDLPTENLQEAIQILDTQAYYMKRQYRLLRDGKEEYRTNQ